MVFIILSYNKCKYGLRVCAILAIITIFKKTYLLTSYYFGIKLSLREVFLRKIFKNFKELKVIFNFVSISFIF